MLPKELTKPEERFIFKKVKKKVFLAASLFFLISLVFSSHKSLSSKALSSVKNPAASPQNVPDKKPKYDYMSTLLSRNTKPLGLKEDQALEKLLKQPSIKWAIRAGKKHILE